jgi:tetratricopeptide (TPR) repeat protein
MIAVVLVATLLAPGPSAPAVGPLDVADSLAAQARAIKGDSEESARARAVAIQSALDAYGKTLRIHEKDAKLAPRIRRRRAALFVQASRYPEALAEHDAILKGRARRKDCARALFEGARVLERMKQPVAAIARLSRALDRYGDVSRVRARSALQKGVLLEAVGQRDAAANAYRIVVKKCRAQEKEAIAAFDALAVLALRNGDTKKAQRWIDACLRTYAKRATRGDKKGAFLGRQIGAMKSPVMLVKAGRH